MSSATPESAASLSRQQLTMIVGTYTDGGGHGIYSYRFDQEKGEAMLLDSLAMTNPSYLIRSHNGRYIYAVSEQGDDVQRGLLIALLADGIDITAVVRANQI